jgi:hypothetical protein
MVQKMTEVEQDEGGWLGSKVNNDLPIPPSKKIPGGNKVQDVTKDAESARKKMMTGK